jgi:hypothetical protein
MEQGRKLAVNVGGPSQWCTQQWSHSLERVGAGGGNPPAGESGGLASRKIFQKLTPKHAFSMPLYAQFVLKRCLKLHMNVVFPHVRKLYS